MDEFIPKIIAQIMNGSLQWDDLSPSGSKTFAYTYKVEEFILKNELYLYNHKQNGLIYRNKSRRKI